MLLARLYRGAPLGRMGGNSRRADALATATLPNGATHCGAYRADVREGPGIYLLPAGGGYIGGFSGSRRSGQGRVLGRGRRLPGG
ncbi:hypothetical protein WJX81_006703 [Elliptochloris bilobata]|uniref:Uncharacterized protein n=1 Tax=Elliptochloris bilobata TaxID=381761 RepID=A0AAW1S157_9CHLO